MKSVVKSCDTKAKNDDVLFLATGHNIYKARLYCIGYSGARDRLIENMESEIIWTFWNTYTYIMKVITIFSHSVEPYKIP